MAGESQGRLGWEDGGEKGSVMGVGKMNLDLEIGF